MSLPGGGLILENLMYLDNLNKQIEIRIPLIPGMNDMAVEEMGAFLGQLKNISKLKVLPYNNLAGSKYQVLGKKNNMPDVETLNTCEVERFMERLMRYGLTVVR